MRTGKTDLREKLQTSCCADAILPGMHMHRPHPPILQNPAATDSSMPTSHLLQYYVTGSKRHTVKKKLVLQFSCTRCVISNTSDNLQRAISGYVTGLTCNHRFGFKVLNRIPSYLSLNFSREPEKYYFHKSYYAHNALEGKHRHCPCPKSIKHGYYRPKESSRLAPVKKNHCYSTNCKTT